MFAAPISIPAPGSASHDEAAAASKMSGAGLPLWLAVGHFIARAPARLARTQLPVFLARVAAQTRGGSDFKRVSRLARRWLRLPGWRARDTCYLRSLVLFRFVNPAGGDLCLHFGVDEPGDAGERLHGHAWVSPQRTGAESAGIIRGGKAQGNLPVLAAHRRLFSIRRSSCRRHDAGKATSPCERATSAGVMTSRSQLGQRSRSRSSSCAAAGS